MGGEFGTWTERSNIEAARLQHKLSHHMQCMETFRGDSPYQFHRPITREITQGVAGRRSAVMPGGNVDACVIMAIIEREWEIRNI